LFRRLFRAQLRFFPGNQALRARFIHNSLFLHAIVIASFGTGAIRPNRGTPFRRSASWAGVLRVAAREATAVAPWAIPRMALVFVEPSASFARGCAKRGWCAQGASALPRQSAAIALATVPFKPARWRAASAVSSPATDSSDETDRLLKRAADGDRHAAGVAVAKKRSVVRGRQSGTTEEALTLPNRKLHGRGRMALEIATA
jgi:hypothetical protein